MRRRLALGLAAVLLAAGAALAAPPRASEFAGTVVRVVDGDSAAVQPSAGGSSVEVRLSGIDAPEICQPWGAEAREALRGLVDGREVRVGVVGRDDHGRTLARLTLDGVDVGERLVRDGHAWSYRYRDDRGPYVAQERMARALGRGLHADGQAIPPRDFRRTHGPCRGPAGPADTATTSATSAATPRPPVAPAAAAAPAVREATARRCDGRRYCSQMTSCDEATWFLRHCPGTEMDGDGDGVPCERQWCAR
jgi:endonuclease YncB( thermonuclease family)